MKISYDKANDALYVHVCDEVGHEVEELEDGIVLDFNDTGDVVGIDIQHVGQRADFTKDAVACSYREHEDIFHIRLSKKQIVREASLDWYSHISYAADKSIVEIVLLDAKKSGGLPSNYQSGELGLGSN